MCVEITAHNPANKQLGGQTTLYKVGEKYSEGENVYLITAYGDIKPSVEYRYVIKQNDDYYLTYMEETCEQVCKEPLIKKDKDETGLRTDLGKVTVGEGVNKGVSAQEQPVIKSKDKDEPDTEPVVAWGCLTPNQCISYASKDQTPLKIKGSGQSVDVEVKSALPSGYTSDCFSPDKVSGDPDERIECCCINSQKSSFLGYYQPEDVEDKEGNFGNTQLENMAWSYRYSKINYKEKEYNENRYIEGRDQMACFGQNHWLYDGLGKVEGTGNLLVLDPFKDTIAAFQCVAISQIRNRLILVQNMMSALQNCLYSIRLTGEADTGVCKELFTQYVCSFIWKIITWLRDGCLPFGSGIDFSKSENKVIRAISVGMDGIWESGEDSQQELASE